MFSIIGAILAIGLLIVVHEAGHYVVARWCKMRVERFSIGFGPPILKWRRGGTDFTIGPIPFGGFVQIAGMTLAEEVDPDDARAYPNRPVWQRFLTIFAGPATNYLFAIVIAIVLYASAGLPSGTKWNQVDDVRAGFDAVGKLAVGDRIVAVDDVPVYAVEGGEAVTRGAHYLQERVGASHGKPLKVSILRDGEPRDLMLEPKLEDDSQGKPVYRIGIGLREEEDARVRVGVGTVAVESLAYPIRQTKLIASGLWEIVTGQQRPVFMGPVGMTGMIKQTFDRGWIRVAELLMLLNVYLGLFNLLPLPALDGGRLVFLGYEMATRRRANPKIEAMVHMVGIMALLLIMVLVTYKDIARIFS